MTDENVLIVAAHPDDEVLGCGGTIARLAEEDRQVTILLLGEGVTSRYEDRSDADQSDLDNLQEQAQSAAKILGAKEVIFGGFPDNRFDTVPLLSIVKNVEKSIEQVKPGTVFTQHGGDVNIDHSLTYRAVLAATRPTPDQSVRSVYSYEVGSSTEWAFHKLTPIFKPTLFYDITTTMDQKIRAMESYSSEVREFPHPRSPESLRAQATRWGSTSGKHYAEAFEVVREIR